MLGTINQHVHLKYWAMSAGWVTQPPMLEGRMSTFPFLIATDLTCCANFYFKLSSSLPPPPPS
jgi:hypothetical protein